MNEFEAILDVCLRQMDAEGSSVEQCVSAYPQYAAELRPLLKAARQIGAGKSLMPSASYKRAARAKIMARMETRTRQGLAAYWPAWQRAAVLAVLVLTMLLSTTAFAQGALPGEPLYGWKLGSEDVWRALSADQVGVDLALVDRRTAELTRIADDPTREGLVWDDFHEILDRLASETDPQNQDMINHALEAHQKKLSDAGIHDKKLDDLVHGKKNK